MEQSKVAGIIVECNPLHEGHRYLFQMSKQVTGAEYTVAVMSGDFVQRGIPAVADKYRRAEEVLRAGCDLVVELPLPFACGGADLFARGAVSLLDSLGVVTDLVFGSESGDLSSLLACAGALAGESPQYQQAFSEALKEGLSWPAARSRALQTVSAPAVPASPNDLLGTEYCKALLLSGSGMIPHAVKRIAAEGATLLRDRLRLGASLESAPCPLFEDDLSLPLIWTLRSLTAAGGAAALLPYEDVSRELADRIVRCADSFENWSSFCLLLKTKGFTYTRISRALLHILLGIRKDAVASYESAGLIGYAHVLGFRRDSEPLLSAVGHSARVPLVLRPASDSAALSPCFASMLQEDARASLLYQTVAQNKYAGLRVLRAVHDEERPVICI